MTPTMTALILDYYEDDVALQTLLGSGSNDVRIAYATLPIIYPSVTLHLDRDEALPRLGYDTNGVSDFSVSLALHVWTRDEGKIIGTGQSAVAYDANSLQLAIAERVRILSLNIDKTIAGLRDLAFSAIPLPFEEDVHIHHTACLLKFTYAAVDVL